MIGRAKLTEFAVGHAREAKPVRIAADGAISTIGVGDGRMLPVLLLDTDERPDLRAYVTLHRSMGPGDVRVQWGQMPDHEDTVMLILSFERPIEMNAIIAFELRRGHGFLIEQILAMNGLYIQAGTEGDRLKNTIEYPRVIVEIPDTGFRRVWDKLFFQFTVRQLRTRGLNRHDAKSVARETIAEMQKFGAFRPSQR